MDHVSAHTTSGDALTFDALRPDSRIWVFAANRAFTEQERQELDALLLKVREKWDIKQPGMRGCHEFVEDRFLIVGADESQGIIDGCSVDAMMNWIMRLEAQTGLRLVDRMTIHYRDAEGAAQSVSRAQFAELAKGGAVTAETHVFDTTIHSVEDLREGRFEVPMSETWLAQAFL
jgi:hypothetical protein